jgi:hypothetical protein
VVTAAGVLVGAIIALPLAVYAGIRIHKFRMGRANRIKLPKAAKGVKEAQPLWDREEVQDRRRSLPLPVFGVS